MLIVRLPESAEKRLNQLAKRTGRRRAHLAQEAILAHLEEHELHYSALTAQLAKSSIKQHATEHPLPRQRPS